MFVRTKCKRARTGYYLVISERQLGKPRQRVVCYFGSLPATFAAAIDRFRDLEKAALSIERLDLVCKPHWEKLKRCANPPTAEEIESARAFSSIQSCKFVDRQAVRVMRNAYHRVAKFNALRAEIDLSLTREYEQAVASSCSTLDPRQREMLRQGKLLLTSFWRDARHALSRRIPIGKQSHVVEMLAKKVPQPSKGSSG